MLYIDLLSITLDNRTPPYTHTHPVTSATQGLTVLQQDPETIVQVNWCRSSSDSAGMRTHRQSSHMERWPIIISLHFLSGLQSSCLKLGLLHDYNRTGSTALACRRPKNLLPPPTPPPPIINNNRCFIQSITFALITQGRLKVAYYGMELCHICYLPLGWWMQMSGYDKLAWCTHSFRQSL